MTTCPSAPRQARGLRGAALRRLSAGKCPRIYQTHDMWPNRCDARPLAAPWHGEAMTNETKEIPAKATDWLAQQVVVDGRSHGFADGVVLRWPDDRQVATIDPSKVLFCNPGQELAAVRAWLVQQIETGYHAGVEAGRAANAYEIGQAHRAMVPGAEKALAAAKDNGTILGWQKNGETSFFVSLGHGPDLDVCAREVPVVLKAADKVRRREILVADGRVDAARGDALTAHANELRAALGVTDPWDGCIVTVRDLVAKDKARPAPTDAAAEEAAIDGLVRDAFRDRYSSCSALTRAGEESYLVTGISTGRARGWLRPWLLAAWARGVAYGQQPDAPPVLADSFGVAAREQVAAERAVDAAAVAPSEEALVRARAEGAVEAFRKVAEWCQTTVPDGIDLDASIVEEVAKDAIGTLQHAAGAGDERMREEGRKEAYLNAIEDQGDHSFIMTQETAATTEKTAEELRRYLSDLICKSHKAVHRLGWSEATKMIDGALTDAATRAEELIRRRDTAATELEQVTRLHDSQAQRIAAIRSVLARVNSAAPGEVK